MRSDDEILAELQGHDAEPLRVLVAEDSAVNQFLMLSILEAAGCDVDVAGDGKGAVEQVVNKEYDLILMDQFMPGMDGPEAVAAIRQLDTAVASVPIIAVTTDSEAADRFRAGVDDFVSKPFDPIQLFEAISRVTSFAPSPAELAEIVAGLDAVRAPASSD